MISLSDTLLAEQKKASVDALIKIALTHGEDSYTYDRDRIVDLDRVEEIYSHKAEIVLDNSDKSLTDLGLKGFQGVTSFGAITGEGNEYCARAPLWVIDQRLESSPGGLTCTLSLVGIPNLLAEDKASVNYTPDEDDTKTVKELVNQLLGATLEGFTLCQAYEVVWDAGYDILADTYKPKDGFRIYVGGNRLAQLRRLLDYTGNVPRFEADGKIHILKPVTTGVSYDYEYYRAVESGHPFWAKAYRKALVIPNYIVVQSYENDDPQYSGFAKDDDSYDLIPKRFYKQMKLESDAQAALIAGALLSKEQLATHMGSATIPMMNVGAELFDYVKVTDDRENDYRVGNIGYLGFHYKPGRGRTSSECRLSFSFGNWFSQLEARRILQELESYSDEGNYFSRLTAKDAYIENLLVESLNINWIDPEGNIDLSEIGDDLDSLPDGENYARILRIHLSAEGGLKLDEHVIYASGYDPTDKFDLDLNDLDDLKDGYTYQRVKSSALTPTGLVILDNTYIDWGSGTYGLSLRSDYQAGKIKLSSVWQSSEAQYVSDAQKTEWTQARDDIEDMADDSKITPAEKLKLKQEWDAVMAEKADIQSMADELGVSRTAYDAAYNALYTYIVTTTNVFGNMSTTTTVVRTAWNSKWNTYFDEKVKILTKLSESGHIYAAEAYVIAIDATEGMITVCQDTNFDGEWYDEPGVIIDADEGIIIRGSTQRLFIRYYTSSALATLYAITNDCFQIQSTDRMRLLALDTLELAANNGIELEDGLIVQSSYPNTLYDIDPYNSSSYIGKGDDPWARGYFVSLYRTHEYDLQHYDDVAFIRQMKEDKANPGFTDPATIPGVILETREEALKQMAEKTKSEIRSLKNKFDYLIPHSQTRPDGQSLVYGTAEMIQRKKAKLAERENDFKPCISINKEISLALGAIRQIADKLDALDDRLKILEAK